MKNLYLLIVCILFNCFAAQAIGNNAVFIKKERPAFDSIETIFQRIQQYDKLSLTFNFDSLLINKKKDLQHPATMVLKGKDQTELVIHTKIKPRGKFRRMRCDFPPIRLNFKKSALKALNLYGKYDKLKMVTHCKNQKSNDIAILKEYWTYKMFNEVSDSSFRVHLLEITYIDETDTTNQIENHAIIIENADEMAHRLNGELVEGRGIQPTDLAPIPYQNVLLFNYMIGNTDWELKNQKNLKLVKHKNSKLYTVIPYDFGFAKIVSTSYLRMDKTVPNVDNNNRAAMGVFNDLKSLERGITKFQNLKETGFTCFNKCKYLGKKDKTEMAYFMKSFFKKTKKKQALVDIFLAKS